MTAYPQLAMLRKVLAVCCQRHEAGLAPPKITGRLLGLLEALWRLVGDRFGLGLLGGTGRLGWQACCAQMLFCVISSTITR